MHLSASTPQSAARRSVSPTTRSITILPASASPAVRLSPRRETTASSPMGGRQHRTAQRLRSSEPERGTTEENYTAKIFKPRRIAAFYRIKHEGRPPGSAPRFSLTSPWTSASRRPHRPRIPRLQQCIQLAEAQAVGFLLHLVHYQLFVGRPGDAAENSQGRREVRRQELRGEEGRGGVVQGLVPNHAVFGGDAVA